MAQLDNTATHKYIFQCFKIEDFNKLLHLFEDKDFIKEIQDNINDKLITLNINIIDNSGIYINILKNNNEYFHISFHIFSNDLRQNSKSEGIFHIKNKRNKSVTRLRLNKKCNITNKNKKTIVFSIGRNPSRKVSISKDQKIITQKIIDIINLHLDSELSTYFRKLNPSHNHRILSSLDRHIKQNSYLRQISPKGGYRPTKRNLKYLKKWRKGESIGFTMRSSLKAKGLIPRANGTKRVSPKYRR